MVFSLMVWLYYLHLKELHSCNDQYRLIAIIQDCSQKESLKTVYLAEWLNLSLDKPINLYQFDTKVAEQRLLASPLIKKTSVKKILPGTLYIHYHIRVPIAYLGDYTNTAFDTEGTLFPFSPFFTPKKLPVIYIGLDRLEKGWGACLLNDKRLQLAFNILEKMQAKAMDVTQIDVSRAFADSYGQRQIVIIVEECLEREHQGKSISAIQPYILRLNVEDYLQNLANYLILRDHLAQESIKQILGMEIVQDERLILKPSVIDLRIPHLAFIKK